MLVSFSLRNYRSFKTGCTLEMMPGKSRSKPEHIVDDCLRIATIYGANGSGKSNLIRGMKAMKAIVTDPFFCAREPLHHWDAESTVTEFEIEFTVDGLLYRYGIGVESVSNGGSKPSERLYAFPLTYERLYVTDTRYEADREGNLTEMLVFEHPSSSRRTAWPQLGFDADAMSGMFEHLLKNDRMCSKLEYYAPVNAASRLKNEMGGIIGSDDLGKSDEEQLKIVRDRMSYECSSRRSSIRDSIDKNGSELRLDVKRTIDRYPMTVRYALGSDGRDGDIPEGALPHLRNLSDWFSSSLCILDTNDIYIPGTEGSDRFLGTLLDSADLGIEDIGWRGLGNRTKEALYSLSVKDGMRIDEAADLSRRTAGRTAIVAKSGKGIFRFICERGGISGEELVPFRRDGFDSNLFSESDGTVRLIELMSILIPSDGDVTFIVDELDRRLHPKLTRWFIESYLREEPSTKQLIFTTHETEILTPELFRRDEIWFMDKIGGQSDIRSLDGIRGINHNRRLEKLYLDDGALPGIPRCSDSIGGCRWEG